MTGSLIAKDVLMMTQHVGYLRRANHEVAYELMTGMNLEPMLRSAETGLTFRLSWSQILDLAMKRGIDDPNAEVET